MKAAGGRTRCRDLAPGPRRQLGGRRSKSSFPASRDGHGPMPTRVPGPFLVVSPLLPPLPGPEFLPLKSISRLAEPQRQYVKQKNLDAKE